MLASAVVQCLSYSIFPCLASYWISRHDLLRTKLYNLLKADGNNARVLLQAIDIRPQPGRQVFFNATAAAVQVEGSYPYLHGIRCGVLVEPGVLLVIIKTFAGALELPPLKLRAYIVSNGVIQVNRRLVHQASLKYVLASKWLLSLSSLANSMSIVFCLPLSVKLLIYILVALLRASAMAPANDIFPCRVKEDFRAPVPAYILDNACEGF